MECLYIENRPDNFDYDAQFNPRGFRSNYSTPDGFEIEYITEPPRELISEQKKIRLKISKEVKGDPQWWIWVKSLQVNGKNWKISRARKKQVLEEFCEGS